MTTTVQLNTEKNIRWDCEAKRMITETVYGTIRLDIDVEAIIRFLGHKALVNKSGKAVDLGGLVKATRI